MNTEVVISFYKPTGFDDTHVIAGDDRGAAVKAVMAKYTEQELRCVNFVLARLTSKEPT